MVSVFAALRDSPDGSRRPPSSATGELDVDRRITV
jgi:hypothetical protein